MNVTESKSISIDEFNQFLFKAISKHEPSLEEDEIEAVIGEYLADSSISFENDTLPISLILEKAKNSKSSKAYLNETLISLFSFRNENIIQILTQCLNKLREYKETELADKLNWEILLLGKDHFKVAIDSNDQHAVQFMNEYSNDLIDQSKEKDLQIAKNLSLERERKQKRNSAGFRSKSPTSNNNNMNTEASRKGLKRTYSLMTKSVIHKPFDSNKSLKTKSQMDSISVLIEEKQEEGQGGCDDKENKQDCSSSSKRKESVKKNSIDKEIVKEIEEIHEDDSNGNSQFLEIINANNNDNTNNNNAQTDNDSNDNNRLNLNNIKTSTQFNSSSTLPFVITESKVNLVFDEIEFNIFKYVEEVGRTNVLYNISNAILNKYQFFSFVNTERFHTFIDKIRVGYDYLIPYHNDLHAADVLQTCHFIINSQSIKIELDLTSLDICGLFIAAIVHDFKHPGLNNTYHINKRTPIAIRYNDFSILEQLHISSAFKVLSHPNSNIFCDLTIEEFRIIRKRMVECVLGTDMARHAKALNNLRKKVDHLIQIKDNIGSSVCELLVNYIPDENKFDRQQELLTFIIHCADISNTGKIWDICKTWTLLVMNEFFNQGDKEKMEGLPVSFLCDRDNTLIPKSQVSFISNIAIPCFNTLELLFPHCQVLIKNQKDNITQWELVEKEEKEEKKKE